MIAVELDWLLTLRHDRAARDRSGLALAEGSRAIARARERGFEVIAIAAAPKLMPGPATRRQWRELSASVPVLRLSGEAFGRVSALDEPSGLVAVVRQRWHGLPEVAPRRSRLWLALEQLRSPGNFGSILRTCEAAGAAGIILLGDALDPWDPRVMRASMGSVFGQRLVRTDAGAFLRFKHATRSCVVGAAPDAHRDFRRGSLHGSAIVMLGSERRGLSPLQRRLCDQVVRIPMIGATDSLNVSVAAGLLLYESYRQRWPLARG